MICITLAAKYQHIELTYTLQKSHQIVPMRSSDTVNEAPSREQTFNTFFVVHIASVIKNHHFSKSINSPRFFSPLYCLMKNLLEDYLSIPCFRWDTHPFSPNGDPSERESWTRCCWGGRRSGSQGDDSLPGKEQEKDSLGSVPYTKGNTKGNVILHQVFHIGGVHNIWNVDLSSWKCIHP